MSKSETERNFEELIVAKTIHAVTALGASAEQLAAAEQAAHRAATMVAKVPEVSELLPSAIRFTKDGAQFIDVQGRFLDLSVAAGAGYVVSCIILGPAGIFTGVAVGYLTNLISHVIRPKVVELSKQQAVLIGAILALRESQELATPDNLWMCADATLEEDLRFDARKAVSVELDKMRVAGMVERNDAGYWIVSQDVYGWMEMKR